MKIDVSMDRNNPIQDGGSYAMWGSAQIHLDETRAVGTADEIQLLVAEPLPDFVHVIGGERCRVKPQIGVGFEMLPAVFDIVGGEETAE
jgi:hypothetical protein